MPNCSVRNCHMINSRKNRSKGITFHKFPRRDPNLRKVWERNCFRGPSFKASRTSVVCSRHFEKACFYNSGIVMRLREGSIPTQMAGLPSYCKPLTVPVPRVGHTAVQLSGTQASACPAASTRLQRRKLLQRRAGYAVKVETSDPSVYADTNTTAANSTTGNVFPLLLTTVEPQGRPVTDDFTHCSTSPEPEASVSEQAVKEEIDDQEDYKNFIYLTEKSLLRQWRLVGKQENLREDVDIAKVLLLKYFGYSDSTPTVDARCQLCCSPLLPVWKCLSCTGHFVIKPAHPVLKEAAQLSEAVSAKPLTEMPSTQEENKASSAEIDLQNLVSLDMKCEDIEEIECRPMAPEVIEYPTDHLADNTCTDIESTAGEKKTKLVSLLAPPIIKPLQDLDNLSKKSVLPVVKYTSKNPHTDNPLSIPVNKNFEEQNTNIPDTVFIVKKGAGNDSATNVQEITVVKSVGHKTFHDKTSVIRERLLSTKLVTTAKDRLSTKSVSNSQNFTSWDPTSMEDLQTLRDGLRVDELAGEIDAAETTGEQDKSNQKTAGLNEIIEEAEHLNCDEHCASPSTEWHSKILAFHSYCRPPQKGLAKPNVTQSQKGNVNISLSHNDTNEPKIDSMTNKLVHGVDSPENVTLSENHISLQPGIHERNLQIMASDTLCDYDKNAAGDLLWLHEDPAFNASAVEKSPSQLVSTFEALHDFDSQEVEVSSETSASQTNTSAVLSLEAQYDVDSYDKRSTLIPLQCKNSISRNRNGGIKQNKNERNECNKCQKTFGSKYYLQKHISAKHLLPKFVCKFCSHVCLTHSILVTHLQIHTNERLHLCDYCGKQFNLRSTLQQHIKRHQGVEGFSCRKCGKSFLLKQDLISHKLTHISVKARICGVCGRAFRWQHHCDMH